MKKFKKLFFILLIFACVTVAFAPFLIPVPELENLVSEEEFIDSDSKFIEINNVNIHYKESGSGEKTFILLHPFGGGTYSWREVMDDFAQYGRVIAYDRPAFGLTERPMPEDWVENPYGMKANIEILKSLLDTFGIEKAVLVGNSAGGAVAVAFALEYPERVEQLILVAPGVGGGRNPQFPTWALPVMWTPQMHRIGPLFMRDYQESLPRTVERGWFDQTKLTDEIRETHLQILKIKNWDRAFYELVFAPAYPELRGLLPELKVKAYIIGGMEDRLIRTWYLEAVATEIPEAELTLIPQCGHVPQEECPQEFMEVIKIYLQSNK
ncbi:MAG TPA: alpha/beta hydrolase [Anaerolineae bacterium]|nr:alpha/beta hydrolase [Anaerolineae bacterium]